MHGGDSSVEDASGPASGLVFGRLRDIPNYEIVLVSRILCRNHEKPLFSSPLRIGLIGPIRPILEKKCRAQGMAAPVRSSLYSAERSSKSSFHRCGKLSGTIVFFIDILLPWLSVSPLPIVVFLNVEAGITPKLLYLYELG